jgi:hypothetical protein
LSIADPVEADPVEFLALCQTRKGRARVIVGFAKSFVDPG